MNDLLSRVKIASPCRARWEDMTGDDRSRFCGRCEKHVYNFSAMTAVEAEDLIRAKEGKLCGRFYRRKDGTMLTANCPVGRRAYFGRLKVLAAAAVTVLFATLSVMAANRGKGGKGPFAQKCDRWVWTVKGWLGLNPPPPAVMVMGDIAIAPSPPPANPQNAGNKTGSNGNKGKTVTQP